MVFASKYGRNKEKNNETVRKRELDRSPDPSYHLIEITKGSSYSSTAFQALAEHLSCCGTWESIFLL